MAANTNGNGAKWGTGLQQWVRANWLLGALLVGGAVGVTKLNYRIASLVTNYERIDKSLKRLVTIQEASMTAHSKFEVGTLDYITKDLERAHPTRKKEDK